jgi:zinc transporter, ZIP family
VTSPYGAVLALSLLSVLTTVLGVALASLIHANDRAIAIGIGFSTGIMLLISSLDLIPEAYLRLGKSHVAWTTLSGGAVLWLANSILPHIHIGPEHGEADARLASSASLVATGLILHDVGEGFAMANAYIASPGLGVLVAVSIALHNLPEEFAIALPAIALRSKRSLMTTAVLSALAEPVGALIGLVATGLNEALNPYLLAFSAGAMIFVSLHELVPLAQRYGRLEWFAAGLLLSALIYRLLAGALSQTPF